MNAINRPTKPCTNPHCGNTLYTIEYEFLGEKYPSGDPKSTRVFKCTNCINSYPVKAHPRRSNSRRAMDLRDEIIALWKRTDEELQALVSAGTPSGCLLVHSSTFNYHLTYLLGYNGDGERVKLRNFDVQYHARQARVELDNAKRFVVVTRMKLGWQMCNAEQLKLQGEIDSDYKPS